jgi:hypothetical protein
MVELGKSNGILIMIKDYVSELINQKHTYFITH